MRRAVRVSLDCATEEKKRTIRALLESYRGAVNFFIRSLWNEHGSLNKETLARLQNTRLSERYKSQPLRQALKCVVNTKKAAKALNRPCEMPRIRRVTALLDSKFVSIQRATDTKAFDWWLVLSTLKRGERIKLPFRGTAVVNKWLSIPGAKLIQGCAIREPREGRPIEAILWVEIPDAPLKEKGKLLGIDLGLKKLIACSDGTTLRLGIGEIVDKIARRLVGSRSRRRAFAERDNYINQTLNQLPWNQLRVIFAEDLKNMKQGKRPNRSRAFRRRLAGWTYAYVLRRLAHKAEENRVRLVLVPPASTSQMCPVCGYLDERNRQGEAFRCLRCDHSADADSIGARNVLARGLGSLESPTTSQATKAA